MQKELPFWSPHKRAKLFKRYIFGSTIERPDGEKIQFENDRYICYHTFKWQLESDISTGKVQPIKGRIENESNVTIRSTTLLEIQESDIVFLQSIVGAKGMYFMVGAVSQDYIYAPKPIKSFVHLILSSLATDSISIWE